MVDDTRPIIDAYTNVDWMNAIRNDMGYDYQARIPEATQANVQDVIQTLWAYKPHLNQFIDALVNRIGLVLFVEWSWSNPLAPLKRGMLNFGETIEEIMVGLIEADEYASDRDELERELFGSKTPEVQASYHTVNRRNKYKLTVKEPLLRSAFINENGLTTFIGQLLAAAQKSDQLDEFLLMANLFKEMDTAAGGLFNANIADIADIDSNEADSKYALRRMREFGHTLQFPSRAYNPAGMMQAVNPDDLILFTTPGAQAAMDVEALAGAFNIEKAEFAKRTFVLPEQYYGIPGFQAALTTKEFFVVADQRIDTTSLYNPSALFTNYWLHHWQVISASKNAPVVMFNSLRESTVLNRVEYTVADITPFTIEDRDGVVQAVNVERGEYYNVIVNAVTTPEGGPLIAVRYAVEGNTSAFTRVSNDGVLAIGPDELANDLTIRATAVDSREVPQFTKTVTRKVVGDGAILWPFPRPINDADKDGTEEVTPDAPKFTAPDKVKIPVVTGVEYRDGATPVTGTVTIAGAVGTTKTIAAVPTTGYEIASGATASWVFTKE